MNSINRTAHVCILAALTGLAASNDGEEGCAKNCRMELVKHFSQGSLR
ncbi:exported hypothetical protein [Candidatus Sulfopaludibacter sp. SbA3]|nr:exported hypothetical protein [Candidatus Sulfopaludibacter sp. SbA3]